MSDRGTLVYIIPKAVPHLSIVILLSDQCNTLNITI